MQIDIKPIEEAPPAWMRIYEHVERILQGQDLPLVGTVAINIMVNVIMLAGGPERDLAKMDQAIDSLAAALRAVLRAQLDREARHH